MATERSTRGRRPPKLSDAAPVHATSTVAPRLDWHDPHAVAAWLADMRDQTADIIAAGLDATAPPGGRELGRRAARRQIIEAGRKIGDLFILVGLDPKGGAT